MVLSGLEVAWIWPFCLGYPCLSHLHLKAIGQMSTRAETIVHDMPVPSNLQRTPAELCGTQSNPRISAPFWMNQSARRNRSQILVYHHLQWQKAAVACNTVFCTCHHNACTQPDTKVPDD